VKDTQPEQWEKFCTLYPSAPEQKFLERVAEQLNKADPLAANQTMRTFGTLGVLRHELRDRGTRFFLCQFKPEHDLNPDSLARYAKNRLRVVPELVYSPWATEAELTAAGLKAKGFELFGDVGDRLFLTLGGGATALKGVRGQDADMVGEFLPLDRHHGRACHDRCAQHQPGGEGN